MEQKKRLCSEIQLFDICERDSCGKRDGRFCTDSDMLNRFEAVLAEEEPPQHYADEEYDESDEDELPYGGMDGDYEDEEGYE